MSWLSLATKVIPLLWKAGAKATSSIAKATLNNPKTAIAVGAASYAGWHNFGSGESLGTTVGKSMRTATDGAGSFAHDVVNGYTGDKTVEKVKDTAMSVMEDVGKGAKEANGLLGGLGSMLSGLVNMIGSGIGAISNLFNNVGLGKISGLGIFGLIAAGYMMFGRSGILGKIGGALMTMFILNSTTEAKQKEQAAAQTMQQRNTQENQQQSAMRR